MSQSFFSLLAKKDQLEASDLKRTKIISCRAGRARMKEHSLLSDIVIVFVLLVILLHLFK